MFTEALSQNTGDNPNTHQQGMDQQIVVHLHSDKQRTDSHNMDEFQKHYTEEKKSDKRL